MMLSVCVHAGAFQSLPEPTSGQPAIRSVWNTPGFLDLHLSTAGLPYGNRLPETRWRLSPGDALSWANLETWPPSGTWCVCGLYSKLPCLPKDRSLGYSPKHSKEVPLDQNRKSFGVHSTHISPFWRYTPPCICSGFREWAALALALFLISEIFNHCLVKWQLLCSARRWTYGL